MKQNCIFVIILLAALSIVNATPHQLQKRATIFAPCNSGSPNIINVEIYPDPPPATGTITFYISTALKTGIISKGAVLAITPVDVNGIDLDDPVVYDLCESIECPTKYLNGKVNIKSTGLNYTYKAVIQLISASGQMLGCSIGTMITRN